DQSSWLGHLFRVQAAGTQEAINGVSRLQDLELTLRVGPGVLHGVRQQHGAGSHQGNEAVLVERQLLGLVVKLLEGSVEPMGKTIVDLLDRFAGLPAAGRRPAAASLVRNNQGDPFIEGSGQERSLAQTRMTDDRDSIF